MFDDLRSDTPKDNLEETKPRHLVTAKIEPNSFDRVLQSANFGFDQKPRDLTDKDELRLLGPDDLLDWPDPNQDQNEKEDDNGGDGEEELPDWLWDSSKNTDLPDWMKKNNADSDLPIWITGDDIDLTAKNGLPDPKEVFDPNQTQKVIAVKKPDPVLVKKGRTALLVIGVYIILLNLVFWKVPTGLDNILIDVMGIYLTIYLANMGYDVRNLLPLTKQK